VTTLVLLPDGRVDHLAHVLDGIVLTHRVRGSLRDRTDLWLGHGVQPFLTLADCRHLPLVDGGEVRISSSGAPALVGPPGWLPKAERGDLVGLWWRGGRLRVTRVDADELAGPREELHVRTLMAEWCSRERWFSNDDPDNLAALVVHCLALARLEDPGLLASPHAPLDEILHDPVATRRSDGWRDIAVDRQEDALTFCVDGMPGALHAELGKRAQRYGMTFDQFVIALLGHLAWRTPFAEDLEPWERWLPEERPRAKLTVLRGGSARPPGPSSRPPGTAGPPEAG